MNSQAAPRGAVNTDGINEVSMGPNGAVFTNYNKDLNAIEAIDNANGTARAVAYAPKTKRALAGLKTGITVTKRRWCRRRNSWISRGSRPTSSRSTKPRAARPTPRRR